MSELHRQLSSGAHEQIGRIRGIAARATPLWERPFDNERAARLPAARGRLARWREVLGSAVLLKRRVRGSGLAREVLHAALAGMQAEEAMPSWASTLASVLGDGGGELADRSFDANEP